MFSMFQRRGFNVVNVSVSRFNVFQWHIVPFNIVFSVFYVLLKVIHGFHGFSMARPRRTNPEKRG
jgi:hypothetical protein